MKTTLQVISISGVGAAIITIAAGALLYHSDNLIVAGGTLFLISTAFKCVLDILK